MRVAIFFRFFYIFFIRIYMSSYNLDQTVNYGNG